MRRPPGDLVAAGVSASIIAGLWVAIKAGWLIRLDTEVLLEAAALIPPAIASTITRVGDTIVRLAVAAVVAAALLVAGHWRKSLFLILAVAGGAVFNEGLKLLVGRARPDLLPSVEQIHGTSFPSGHAAGAAVLFGSLALLAPFRFRVTALIVAVFAAVLVGASRIALGVHWPSDVMAGFSSAVIWIIIASRCVPMARGTR
ncbi:undecaprenyl-diphosphatase [Sphingomonas jejuensis]|uniref:Undecaprenyl-diphosphatase n=1 Tax=Sphingomonas jejuensis TaxID=904715 RepID=A0ABX0XHC8_9SPHN|nr:phosphatase PAP2 family protein [Sphingomonas jejuensis]NJC32558.1 undecaprenyl-diphosphatase [Sphingomonas jejuensis]